MIERFHSDKVDVVYFEHNEEALRSTQSIGITTYHDDNGRKDLGALQDFLKMNV